MQAYSAASLLCDNEYFDHPKLVSTAVDTTDENINTRVDGVVSELISAAVDNSELFCEILLFLISQKFCKLEKCKIFAKRFFLFAANPTWFLS